MLLDIVKESSIHVGQEYDEELDGDVLVIDYLRSCLGHPDAIIKASDLAISTKEYSMSWANIRVHPPFSLTWIEYVYGDNLIGHILSSLHHAAGCEVSFLSFATTLYSRVYLIGQGSLDIDKHGYLLNNSFVHLCDPVTTFDRNAHIMLRTLALLNCKNVSLEENTVSPKLIKKHAKHGRQVTEKFYTLKIKPMGRRSDSDPQGGTSGKQSQHIMRGHFKTFTEDAPLFGKLTGTYWWESAVRGNPDVGKINKDYEVDLSTPLPESDGGYAE